MKWLMTKIAEAVNVIPQLQNNGPWRKEEFHKTDVQFYSFDAEGTGSSVYKIIFNLYVNIILLFISRLIKNL